MMAAWFTLDGTPPELGPDDWRPVYASGPKSVTLERGNRPRLGLIGMHGRHRLPDGTWLVVVRFIAESDLVIDDVTGAATIAHAEA